MNWVRVNPEDWADLLEKRKCGCVRVQMSDFQHWYRYTRLRYWFRGAVAWVWFIGLHIRHCATFLFVKGLMNVVPAMAAIGFCPVEEAQGFLHKLRNYWEGTREIFRDDLCLGVSNEFPEGIYARFGHHLVAMTEDESRHW